MCECGHDQATHLRDSGQCMHSTETETWACMCDTFRLAAEGPWQPEGEAETFPIQDANPAALEAVMTGSGPLMGSPTTGQHIPWAEIREKADGPLRCDPLDQDAPSWGPYCCPRVALRAAADEIIRLTSGELERVGEMCVEDGYLLANQPGSCFSDDHPRVPVYVLTTQLINDYEPMPDIHIRRPEGFTPAELCRRVPDGGHNDMTIVDSEDVS